MSDQWKAGDGIPWQKPRRLELVEEGDRTAKLVLLLGIFAPFRRLRVMPV